jgi:hypothetical protein
VTLLRLREEEDLLQYLSRLLTALLERLPAEEPTQADYKALTSIAAALFRYFVKKISAFRLITRHSPAMLLLFSGTNIPVPGTGTAFLSIQTNY